MIQTDQVTQDAFQELDSFLFTVQPETSSKKGIILTVLKPPFNLQSFFYKKCRNAGYKPRCKRGGSEPLEDMFLALLRKKKKKKKVDSINTLLYNISVL